MALDKNKLEELAAQYGDSFRAWNFTADVYNASKDVIVVKDCFAFMFTNLGDTIARVNGMIIFPNATPLAALGDSRSLGGHWMDLFKGRLTLSFQAPVNALPQVEIVQLYYVNPYIHQT